MQFFATDFEPSALRSNGHDVVDILGGGAKIWTVNVSEDTLAAALGLLLIDGLGVVRLRRLLAEFGTPEGVISADRELLAQSLGDRIANDVKSALDNPRLPRLLGKLRELDVDVLIWGQPGYPSRLRTIYAAPPVLFVRGRLLPRDDRAVAVVGTRRATHVGERIARQISEGLARSGVTVVSGLAVGIDGVAHRAAIDAGGRTIAVLASGPEIIYPPQHRGLAERIMECGALVTEFPPETAPEAYNFPRRNRIISGLSLGVVVVEAGERSGALITANHAADQGREVFAVPGSPTSPQSAGTNALIKQGAHVATCAQDVLEVLDIPAVAPERLDDAFEKLQRLKGDAKVLFEALSNEPIHIDELARKCKMDTAYALSTLFTLEVEGLVRQLPGKRFVRNV